MEWTEEMSRENAMRKARAAVAARRDPLAPLEGVSEQERMATDFEYWAARCVRIRHKLTGEIVPFVLNGGQRRVLAELENQRTKGKPVRLIVLKCRQCGCSTFILYYMAWIQLMQRRNWNSLVCAHYRTAATVIRGMYGDLVANYPEELAEGMKFGRYRGLADVGLLEPCNAKVTVCTAQNPDAVRGSDYSMAHLSEVAYWPSTPVRSPRMLVRAVCASIPRAPGSVIVMESTANGAGGFFHDEWLRAAEGRSDKAAVFVPWYDIELHTEELSMPEADFWDRLDAYERSLWEKGLTLEQINWYHNKTLEAGGSRREMMCEYPTTVSEAFSNSMPPVFDSEKVEEQRRLASDPVRTAEVVLPEGDIVDTPSGRLQIWREPCPGEDVRVYNPYLVAVDIGGNWEGADWSVIAVFDCRAPGRMELVAQWRGHTDADRLCDIAALLGRRYHSALLVVESNSMEARGLDALERLAADGYPNLYRRRCLDTATGREEFRYGFHTNRESKIAAVNDLIAALRDGILVERSLPAVEELATYIRDPLGEMRATDGCHDDMVMTRAIAAYALRRTPRRPRKPFRPASPPRYCYFNKNY